jgi:hypothetical protein
MKEFPGAKIFHEKCPTNPGQKIQQKYNYLKQSNSSLINEELDFICYRPGIE